MFPYSVVLSRQYKSFVTVVNDVGLFDNFVFDSEATGTNLMKRWHHGFYGSKLFEKNEGSIVFLQ